MSAPAEDRSSAAAGGTGPGLRALAWARAEYRFGLLFLVLLGSAVFLLAAPEKDWARFVTVVFQAVALLLALRAAHVHRNLRRLAAAMLALVVIAASVALLGIGGIGSASPRIVTLALVILAPPAVVAGLVRQLRDQQTVTLQSMFAAICIYLLIAMAFALLYGAIDDLGSEPFFASGVHGTTADFLYFSFSTMTTTGYGDFTAGTDVGRALSITEALLGQIYLVTVIALVVSNLGRQRGVPERA